MDTMACFPPPARTPIVDWLTLFQVETEIDEIDDQLTDHRCTNFASCQELSFQVSLIFHESEKQGSFRQFQ